MVRETLSSTEALDASTSESRQELSPNSLQPYVIESVGKLMTLLDTCVPFVASFVPEQYLLFDREVYRRPPATVRA